MSEAECTKYEECAYCDSGMVKISKSGYSTFVFCDTCDIYDVIHDPFVPSIGDNNEY